MSRLEVSSIERMARDLYEYDVVDQGWEHEGQGFEFNANHVLKHLARDLKRKDFFDRETVKSAIAPDSVQYALRLARWTGTPVDLLDSSLSSAEELDDFCINFMTTSPRIGAYMLAQSTLADFLHDTDHESTRVATMDRKIEMARSVGGLLIRSAEYSADVFEFELDQAFDGRLSYLRDRFIGSKSV